VARVTLDQGIAFFIFSVVAAVTPGPSNVMLTAAGIGEDMIRLSVGLEEASDIADDLAQALRASQKAIIPAKAAE